MNWRPLKGVALVLIATSTPAYRKRLATSFFSCANSSCVGCETAPKPAPLQVDFATRWARNSSARSSGRPHSAANWPRRPDKTCSAVVRDQFEPCVAFISANAEARLPSSATHACTTRAALRMSGKSELAPARVLAILARSAGLWWTIFTNGNVQWLLQILITDRRGSSGALPLKHCPRRRHQKVLADSAAMSLQTPVISVTSARSRRYSIARLMSGTT